MKTTIGHDTHDNAFADVDISKLVSTRMVIQASSGGGKSNDVRLLAEAAGGARVQFFIIDREGEFVTLREKVDVLWVGEGGELPATSKNAGALALKLLETGTSAVLDLFGLSMADQKEFVRAFIDNMNAAPRELWHPVLVFIDEAHLFCPEKGQGEAVSAEAIELLMSTGRKRGYCGVLSTQRISKLSKNAVAEANNKMIGLCNLDVDYKRAGDELGFSKDQARELREMELGQFYAMGPAFSFRGYRKVQVNEAATKPPKLGHGQRKVAAPSDAIRGMLPALAELGKAANPDDVNTIDSARARITELSREVKGLIRKAGAAATPAPAVDARAIAAKADANARKELCKSLVPIHRSLVKSAEDLEARVATLRSSLSAFTTIVEAGATVADPPLPASTVKWAGTSVPAAAPRVTPSTRTEGLTHTQHRILDTVRMLNDRGLTPTRDMVARWQNLHPSGGRFGTDLGYLRGYGYLDGMALIDKALTGVSPTGFDALLAVVDQTKKNILNVLAVSKKPLSRDELAELLTLHPSGGRFGTDLGWLRTMGVIPKRGPISLTPGALA